MNNYEQTLSSHCPHSLRGRHQNPNGNFRDPARNRLGLYTDMPLKYRNRDLYAIYLYLYAYIYICMTYVYIYHKPRIDDLPQFFGPVLDQPLAAGWCSAASPWICSRAWRCIWELADVCVCVCFSECVYVYIMFQIDIQCYMCIWYVCNVM